MIDRRLFLTGSAASTLLSCAPALAEQTKLDYELTPKPGLAQLLDRADQETQIWGYDGRVPGPLIKAQAGQPLRVEVINQLDQPTSVHWHGIRLDNSMDGVSGLTQKPINPGDRFVYEFTPPDAGTYWYHPHNRTWEQMARGLYGLLIVEGDEDLEKFDRDLNLVADDWRIGPDGVMDEASFGNLHDWSHAGRLGNILTLNGKSYETLNVISGERVRLRIVNTSNARTMRFGIASHQPWLIALDGQPIPPVQLGEKGVLLAPAQRADLAIDIAGKPGDRIPIVELSTGDELIAGYLQCEQGKESQPKVESYELLKHIIPQPDLSKATNHELLMSGGAMRFLTKATFKGEELDGRELARVHGQTWAFNLQAGMSEKPLFSSQSGETIRLKIVNETAWPHAIHLHGHHFRIVSRASYPSGKSISVSAEEKHAFRDTVLLERDEVAEIAFVADNPGKWMLHCHMLEHQASGMGTWFQVN